MGLCGAIFEDGNIEVLPLNFLGTLLETKCQTQSGIKWPFF